MAIDNKIRQESYNTFLVKKPAKISAFSSEKNDKCAKY